LSQKWFLLIFFQPFVVILGLNDYLRCKITKMYRLNLPPYEIKITEKEGKRMIFDLLRRKYVSLTPEEWVRQHFVHYLITQKEYPQGLLTNEVQLQVGDKLLRCDTLLYNQNAKPRMIIEYKAPTVPLTQKVFDQITVYNFLLHVDYLIVSNGLQHICCRVDYEHQQYTFLEDIPAYKDLQTIKTT
jgi:hypothetical protein